MPRVKRGVRARAKHKKIFKITKGFRGKHKNTVKLGRLAMFKAGQHAYVGRRVKKRTFASLWIARINAACKANGLQYSRLIYGMELANIKLNRKMLAEIAVNNPEVFTQVANQVKAALPTK